MVISYEQQKNTTANKQAAAHILAEVVWVITQQKLSHSAKFPPGAYVVLHCGLLKVCAKAALESLANEAFKVCCLATPEVRPDVFCTSCCLDLGPELEALLCS